MTIPTEGSGSGGGAHILLIPFPAQGHMIPLLDLICQLAIHGLTITILITPENLSLLTPSLLSHHSINTLVLPFPTHPSIPSGVENFKDLPTNTLAAMMRTLGDLYNPQLLHWFNSHPSPPVAIISDMFLGWTHHLASHLTIPRFVFSPSGALALSTMYSMWRHLPKPTSTDDEHQDQTAVISFPNIPNCPKYPWWQISPLYRSFKEGDPISEFVKDGFHANMASWGLVINSFTELEGIYLNHLANEFGHHRVWAVGPLLPKATTINANEDRGGSSSTSTVDIMSWLDTCEDHSVVYVCFGSQTVLTNKQIEELALGLEKSGAKFILSVKGPTTGHVEGHGTIPSGFEDRVEGRGFVIKGWAPQVMILSHRAVGVFLTHCGWNSVLEGLVGGVTMVAWPMGADQFPNATLIEGVDNEKVANHLDRVVSSIQRKPLKVLVQVNTSGEPSKSGVEPSDCVALAKYVKLGCSSLEFSGLMTIGMPDYTSTPENFRTLLNCRFEVCKALGLAEEQCELSMGMSSDFEQAIEMGSTNVRIGSTIFGPREYPKKQSN